jgi:hypothetical protein
MKPSPFNLPGTIVEIEIFADTIYYILYGKYKIMTKIKDMLNDHCEKNKLNKKYIISKLNLPVARLCDNQQESFNQKSDTKFNFEFNNCLESIQCLVYADCNNKEAKDMYTILCLDKNSEKNSYELKYPYIELNEDFDPEEIIYKEFKKISYPHAKYIKKNLKLVDIAGENDEILVYSCKILDSYLNKEIKIYKKKIENK